jgi:hypothetical protein
MPSWEERYYEEIRETERMLEEHAERGDARRVSNPLSLFNVFSDGREGIDGPVEGIMLGGVAIALIVLAILVLLGLGGMVLRIWIHPKPAAVQQVEPPAGSSSTAAGNPCSAANPCAAPNP